MKIKLKVGLLSAVVSLLFSIPSAKSFGSLTEFTKPYQGTYTCKQLKCGDTDMKGYLKDLVLELTADGKAVIYAKDLNGNNKKTEGEYSFNEEKKTLTLTFSCGGKPYSKELIYQNGGFSFTFLVGGKLFYGAFEQN